MPYKEDQIDTAIVSMVLKEGITDRMVIADRICKEFKVTMDVPNLAIHHLCGAGGVLHSDSNCFDNHNGMVITANPRTLPFNICRYLPDYIHNKETQTD